MMNKPTKADYRRFLNERYPVPTEGQYTVNQAGTARNNTPRGPKTRPYGDYLYAQDRDMFNYEFNAWIAADCPSPKSAWCANDLS